MCLRGQLTVMGRLALIGEGIHVGDVTIFPAALGAAQRRAGIRACAGFVIVAEHGHRIGGQFAQRAHRLNGVASFGEKFQKAPGLGRKVLVMASHKAIDSVSLREDLVSGGGSGSS